MQIFNVVSVAVQVETIPKYPFPLLPNMKHARAAANMYTDF